MSYPVTAADVASRWRPLSSEEVAVANIILADLSDELDIDRPLLQSILVDPLLDPDKIALLLRVIVKTLANATKRALRNPDTLRSTSIGADGSIGVGYDNKPIDLIATNASLTPADLLGIDRATVGAGGTTLAGIFSRKLQAWSELAPN